MDLGYVEAKRQWFIATVCLLQFKPCLLSDLWSSIHHQRILRDTWEQAQGYWGNAIYTTAPWGGQNRARERDGEERQVTLLKRKQH